VFFAAYDSTGGPYPTIVVNRYTGEIRAVSEGSCIPTEFSVARYELELPPRQFATAAELPPDGHFASWSIRGVTISPDDHIDPARFPPAVATMWQQYLKRSVGSTGPAA
jgi:hypothetical protein